MKFIVLVRRRSSIKTGSYVHTVNDLIYVLRRATLDVTMATDKKDELLRSVSAQNISVGVATGSESVNTDLSEDPHLRKEGSKLSETVCR